MVLLARALVIWYCVHVHGAARMCCVLLVMAVCAGQVLVMALCCVSLVMAECCAGAGDVQ